MPFETSTRKTKPNITNHFHFARALTFPHIHTQHNTNNATSFNWLRWEIDSITNGCLKRYRDDKNKNRAQFQTEEKFIKKSTNAFSRWFALKKLTKSLWVIGYFCDGHASIVCRLVNIIMFRFFRVVLLKCKFSSATNYFMFPQTVMMAGDFHTLERLSLSESNRKKVSLWRKVLKHKQMSQR